MVQGKKSSPLFLLLHVFFISMLLIPQAAVSADVCSQGVGIPPFISAGASPNLLLLLDNSGSMLDPAYVESDGECFDDSFAVTNSYTGYFEQTAWYQYVLPSAAPVSTTEDRFVMVEAIGDEDFTDIEERVCNGSNRSKSGVVCLTLDDLSNPTTVLSFYATGQFLNWATASKFDIQKKILTGGKWEDDPNSDASTADGRLVMESRGCSNRRFVKEVALDQSETDNKGTQYYSLTMGVRPPMEQQFDLWESETAYNMGDIIRYQDVIYECITDPGHTSTTSFDETMWEVYKQSRWYPGEKYGPGAVVYDTSSFRMYKTVEGGTSSGETVAIKLSEDQDVVWEEYDLTHIDLYNVTLGGFQYDACYLALQELGALTGEDTDAERTRLGQLKAYTDECLSYDKENKTEEGYSNAAFNGSMQECWYYNKFGHWQPGGGSVSSLKNACQGLYEFISPQDISVYDTGYVCSGTYGAGTPLGFAGRCWEPPFNGEDPSCTTQKCTVGVDYGDYIQCNADGEKERCIDWNSNSNKCQPSAWQVILDCEGGGDLVGDEIIIAEGEGVAPGGWTNDPYYVYDECVYTDCGVNNCVVSSCSGTADGATCTVSTEQQCNDITTWTRDEGDSLGYWSTDDDGYYCVDQALRDFCATVEVPELIDPSDATGLTGEVWNAPAMLVDSAVYAQLDEPLLTMKGYLAQPEAPEGVLQEVAGDLRLGAMAFNKNGAATECPETNDGSAIAYDCPATNQDGAHVIAVIDQGDEHTARLTQAVNDIKANSWTPLAEAMYNAIGYYTQRTDMRLNSGDFLTEEDVVNMSPLPEEWINDTLYPPETYVSFEGKYYFTFLGGTSDGIIPDNDDDVGNDQASLLYDEGVHWTPVDPVQYSCQQNHILVITEGASTADINQQVIDFVSNAGLLENVNEDPADLACTDGLHGSTYLDDLTYFSQFTDAVENDDALHEAAASALYTANAYMLGGEIKSDITTHIVTTGSLRDEGDNSECSPANIMTNAAVNGGTTLYSGENPDQLEDNLRAVFNDLLTRASAGSAASVISSSRSGAGAVYQAIFWPELVNDSNGDSIEWAGDVHALFLSSSGLMYEDTNGDGQLSPSSDLNNNGVVDGDETGDGNGDIIGVDKRVLFYYSDTARRTRACLNVTDYFANDLICSDDPPIDQNCALDSDCRELQDVNYIWSAADWLGGVDNGTAIETNRSTYLASDKQRYIFTWNDLNADGVVDTDFDDDGQIDSGAATDEVFPFTPSILNAAVTGTRGSVLNDFVIVNNNDIIATDDIKNEIGKFIGDTVGDTPEELLAGEKKAAAAVIEWIRGKEQAEETADDNGNGRLDKALRSRAYPIGDYNVWRLGDVIHSTPTVVGKPAEAYHFIYRDPTYSRFAARWATRRQVVYFGANDGMVHAINSGFYHEGSKSFCRELNADYDITDDDSTNDSICLNNGPELGAELWAYVPYNLTPHLKCLTEPEYEHKYYVDQRPRIFDVQIFSEEGVCSTDLANDNCVHPGGWGTIMVGSMRFGGTSTFAADVNATPADTREFTSAFFILDITDPENPPQLLAEMTMTDDDACIDAQSCTNMGYTTSSPTMVVMRDDDGTTDWYLVMGSGPATLKGENDQQGKIAILPLEWISPATVAANRKPFRIPDARPGNSGSQGGVFVVPRVTGEDTQYSFISDLTTVDFDVEQPGNIELGAFYKSDAVYFGTVDGEGFQGIEGSTEWNGGGRLFRLVTKVEDNGTELVSTPSQWAGEWSDDDEFPNEPLRMLVDAKAPITSAQSVGWDGRNYWVYGGTGRFYDKWDKPDQKQQRFFGIREPIDLSDSLTCSDNKLSWAKIDWDVTTDSLLSDAPTSTKTVPGKRGLLRTDNIITAERASNIYRQAYLQCASCVEDAASPDGTSCTSLASADCFPENLGLTAITYDNNGTEATTDLYLFDTLRDYIAGTGCSGENDTGIDGWYRVFHEPRERNLGQPTLLGGLLTYTGYQPYDDVCKPEGVSFLYGVHYQTGTPWYESVFGSFSYGSDTFVKDKLSLGRGLSTTPSLHTGSGDGATAFVQTSTGEIKEISQDLPLDDTSSGRTSWTDQCN